MPTKTFLGKKTLTGYILIQSVVRAAMTVGMTQLRLKTQSIKGVVTPYTKKSSYAISVFLKKSFFLFHYVVAHRSVCSYEKCIGPIYSYQYHT